MVKNNFLIYTVIYSFQVAIVTTEDNPHNQFGGASMIAAIYNPRSTGQQHSGCRLKLIKGKNIIQTGWRVSQINYTFFVNNIFSLYH